jgi:hypothetical protein
MGGALRHERLSKVELISERDTHKSELFCEELSGRLMVPCSTRRPGSTDEIRITRLSGTNSVV